MKHVIARGLVTNLAALTLLVCSAWALAADSPFKELLEMSLNTKKGLTFYVNGQIITGGVTRIGEDVVEVKSREFGRILIRLDRIDAVAAN